MVDSDDTGSTGVLNVERSENNGSVDNITIGEQK